MIKLENNVVVLSGPLSIYTRPPPHTTSGHAAAFPVVSAPSLAACVQCAVRRARVLAAGALCSCAAGAGAVIARAPRVPCSRVPPQAAG